MVGYPIKAGTRHQHTRQRICIARIEQPKHADAFTVGWFSESETEPFASSDYAGRQELFLALDEAIARRSAEVGGVT